MNNKKADDDNLDLWLVREFYVSISALFSCHLAINVQVILLRRDLWIMLKDANDANNMGCDSLRSYPPVA